jgi:hypothetical protein
VTDSLKRGIEKAHRNNLQSQPSQDEPQSSVSLPEHPTKRRKTAADADSRKSPNGSPEKKVPVTYGKRPKSISTSSPTFRDPARERPGSRATGVYIAPSEETIWNLEGTLRDTYAQHEPAMFPEPSSTVPNATMTQQRVLDAVNAPAMLGQDSDAVRSRFVPPPEPSVPLSDIWKFTPAEAGEQTESSDHAPASDLPSATPLRTSQSNLGLSASQRSRRGSYVHARESPLKNEVFHAEVADMGQRPSPFEASPASVSEIPLTALSKFSHSQETSGSPRRQKSKAAVIASSDDDPTAIGLPKEQYKPRPSRSRSLKVDVEHPIDYSVKPEKAKRISKRRKTSGAVGDSNAVTTPQKVQQICDMGFTPSTTTAALKRNNGDVSRSIDWLVTNNIGHDELAPRSPLKTKSTPKQTGEMPAVDPETIQNIMRNLNNYRRDDTPAPQTAIQTTVANNNTIPSERLDDAAASLTTLLPSDAALITSPTEVRVLIPQRTPRTTSAHASDSIAVSTKRPKRRKTTLDQPESEPMTESSVVPEVVPEKKKSRGRSKKAANTVTSTKPTSGMREQSVFVEQPDEVLQAIEPNMAFGKANMTLQSSTDGAEVLEQAEPNSTAQASDPMSKISLAAASETPEKSTKPTNASPSITKGKVPYRVGLSKRARIAPLLRIMKK